MLLKLEKFLLFLARRKLFFFILTFGGLLSPLYSAQAAFKWYYLIPGYWYIRGAGAITGWGTELVGIKLGAYIAALVTTILQIPLFLANVFLAIAAGLLDLATSPTFINLSYTKLDNPIIRMGWTVTRDLANMGIVLGLIVIGVATILRIEGYQAKKTLPVLIIIALLINFTPVLLGIIVDASNIIMNFFLQGSLETSGFMELMKNQWGAIVDSWAKATEAETPADILAPLGETVALTFYGFIAGFIFLVFAFIFIMRYIAIWILVILSPLAFVAYILPHTKKYFDQWWKQFLNWCFIGVWAAFFLYLSNGLLALATGQGLYGVQKLPIKTIAGEGGTPATTGLPGLLNDLLPYYVIIGFLVLGLVTTLSISAYGTSAIINFAKTKGKAGAKWAAKRIPAGTMAATAGAARGLGKGFKEGKGWGRITGATTGAFKGAATYEGREKGREVMGRMLEKAHLVRPGAYETARRKRWKIEEETKRLDALPTDRLHEIAHRAPLKPADRRGAIAAFEVLAKRSALGGPPESENEKKEKALLPLMQSFGADTKQALKARPDWAPAEDTKKQIEGTTPGDFTKNTQAEALRDIKVARHLDAAKIRLIGVRGTSQQKKAIADDAAPKLKSLIQELRQKSKTATLSKEEQEKWLNLILILQEIKLNPNFY